MHYTVMVTGLDVDSQMAPFLEYGAANEEEAKHLRWEEVDITDECLADYALYVKGREWEDKDLDAAGNVRMKESFTEWLLWWHQFPILTARPDPTVYNKEWGTGYCVRIDGQPDLIIARVFPDQQWDWYVVGGRWNGLLRLKHDHLTLADDNEYGFVNSARKGEIDRSFLVEQRRQLAGMQWDTYHELQASRFEEDYRLAQKENNEKLVNFLESTPMYEYLRDVGIRFDWYHNTPWSLTREEYITDFYHTYPTTTYAILHEGKWRCRDEYYTSDFETKDLDAWREHAKQAHAQSKVKWFAEFQTWWDALPDDTWVTILDYHC